MADVAALKVELISVASQTDNGFEAGGAAVDRIKVLSAALESANPTPDPAQQAEMLRGRWQLLYSSFGLERETTLARLSFNVLPKIGVRVNSVWQEVQPERALYDNIVECEEGPVIVEGRYAAQSGSRLGVEFYRAFSVLGMDHYDGAIDNGKIPSLHSDVTFLDRDFRLNRGGFGNLYVLQLIDRSPSVWSRDL
ncbi:MAG: fibrillin [Sphingomonadaceae bacterium]|nr:fibrillin [Sphingomonadaceae bacterium]